MNEHSYSVSQQTQVARLSARMQRELKWLQTDPPPGICAWPSDDNLLTRLEAQIEGPEGTVYAKGVFKLEIQVPERYPFEPPNVKFVTPIYHPNIDNGGRICLDILNLPPKGAWAPSLNIATVLASIGLLLSDPNPDDGLMGDISAEYKHNRSNFDQKARSCTQKYAMQMDHQPNTFPMEISCADRALLTGQTSNEMIGPLKQINEIAVIPPSGALDQSNHKGEVESVCLVNPVKSTQSLSKKLSLAREPVLQPTKDPCEIRTDGQRRMSKESVNLQLAQRMDTNAQQKCHATSILQTNDGDNRLLEKGETSDSSSLMQNTYQGLDRSTEEIILLEKENLQARSWIAKKPASKLLVLKPLDGNSTINKKENMKTVQLQKNISIQTNQSIPPLQNDNKRRRGELENLQSSNSSIHGLPVSRSVQPEECEPINSTEEILKVEAVREIPTVIVSDSESDEEPVKVRSRLSLSQRTLTGKRKLRSNVG